MNFRKIKLAVFRIFLATAIILVIATTIRMFNLFENYDNTFRVVILLNLFFLGTATFTTIGWHSDPDSPKENPEAFWFSFAFFNAFMLILHAIAGFSQRRRVKSPRTLPLWKIDGNEALKIIATYLIFIAIGLILKKIYSKNKRKRKKK